MKITLYDYQEKAVERCRDALRAGVRNIVLALPTGAGKTVIAVHLIDECHQKGKRAIFVADRVSLIDQTSATLDRYNIPHGVIQASHWRFRPWERIQVASAQTLVRRNWPAADLIVVDEAHCILKVVADRIGKRDAVTLGLTATPFTRGLGELYEEIVTATTTNKLIEERYLAPFRIFAASEPDMTGARVLSTGEWADDEVERRTLPIIGDCVSEYLKHGEGRKFLCFGVNVAHCEEMQRHFASAGVVSSLYTYRSGDQERATSVEEFRKPDSYIRGLISVGALSKGFDVPDVGCIIMCRPLRKSLAEHIQIFGRGLRSHPDKTDCVVLDHSGNCLRFWAEMVEFFDRGVDSLDERERKAKTKALKREREPMKCPGCAHVHEPNRHCPECGHEYPKRLAVVHESGILEEMSGAATLEQRQEFHAMLAHVALQRDYNAGWVKHKYRERFGAWPRGMQPEPIEPTSAVLNWIRSRQIAYAKRKRAA